MTLLWLHFCRQQILKLQIIENMVFGTFFNIYLFNMNSLFALHCDYLKRFATLIFQSVLLINVICCSSDTYKWYVCKICFCSNVVKMRTFCPKSGASVRPETLQNYTGISLGNDRVAECDWSILVRLSNGSD